MDSEDLPSPRADFFSALFWIIFGAAVLYGAWTMDRLEYLHINPYTAPGLVPGFLGALLILFGALLLLRAVYAGGHRRPASAAAADRSARLRLLITLLLCLGYGAGLVGRGLPFWLATAIFVSVFVLIFEWPMRRERGETVKGALLALIYGLGTAGAVQFVFQEIFLVRLP